MCVSQYTHTHTHTHTHLCPQVQTIPFNKLQTADYTSCQITIDPTTTHTHTHTYTHTRTHTLHLSGRWHGNHWEVSKHSKHPFLLSFSVLGNRSTTKLDLLFLKRRPIADLNTERSLQTGRASRTKAAKMFPKSCKCQGHPTATSCSGLASPLIYHAGAPSGTLPPSSDPESPSGAKIRFPFTALQPKTLWICSEGESETNSGSRLGDLFKGYIKYMRLNQPSVCFMCNKSTSTFCSCFSFWPLRVFLSDPESSCSIDQEQRRSFLPLSILSCFDLKESEGISN